jgi:hypothetical protein
MRNGQAEFIYLLACFISEIINRNSIDFGTRREMKFNFHSYPFNMTSYFVKLNSNYMASQKWLIVQNIGEIK